jgi:hypothetical protein
VLLTTAAMADDREITSATQVTDPVFTATAGSGTPGNLTIDQGGTINIATSGAAVTLNSNNTISNSGTIQTTALSTAIGVHILGGFTGSYDEAAAAFINVTGGGTGNYGILVDGNGTFTGNITLEASSNLIVHGVNSAAIAVKTTVSGSINVGGYLSGTDSGVNGVVVTAPVNGTLTTSGSMVLLGLPTQLFTSTEIDAQSGSGVAIGANITGGYLNSGPTDATDALAVTGTIQSSSTAPTVLIAPSVAGSAAGNFTIGLHTGESAQQTFSVVNRGSISAQENDPGLSTTAVRIGEHAPGAPAHTVTLTGGFFNSGTIQSSSESDNLNATNAHAAPTDAIGVEIGNGAILLNAGSHPGQTGAASSTSTIVLDASASSTDDFYKGLIVETNGEQRVITAYDGATKTASIGTFNGSSPTWSSAPVASQGFSVISATFRNDGQIKAFMNGTETGTVTGILIQPSGSSPTLINTGTISAQAQTRNSSVSGLTAYAVRDLSGQLNDITNLGTIIAVSGYNPGSGTISLDDNSQKAVSLDLSAGTSQQTVRDYGTVTGDIYFGSAAGNSTVAGNQLIIDGANSGASGAIHATGNGTLDIHVSQRQTGGTLLTQSTQASSINVGNNGQVVFLLTKHSPGTTVITSSGSGINFDEGSTVSLLPGTFLPNGTYTLIDTGAPNKLHFANAQDSTASFNTPFLFNSTLATDNGSTVANNGQSLKVTLTRKTAAELGLTGNAAAIYEPLSAAALNDDTFGSALMGLSNQSQVQSALKSAVPDVAGGVRALALAMTDQATGVIAARQRGLLAQSPDSRTEFRFWAQEFYSNVRDGATSTTPGFGGAGQGLALGTEWGNLNTGRYGVGLTYFSSQETEEHPRDTKTDADWVMASAYSAWRFDNFFIGPQINAASGSMQSRRSIDAGSLMRSGFGHWQSQMVAGGVTSGYIFDIGDFQVIPTVAIDSFWLREGSYNESRAGGIGVNLKPQTQDSTRAFAGIIGQGVYAYDQGSLLPQVVVGYSHEFLNNQSAIDGIFQAAPGSPFHLTGPTLDPNRVVGGMSFGYVLRNWTAGINYDASANTGELAQSATVSISSRF